MAHDVATCAVALLRQAHVPLEVGLQDDELRAVQQRFGFEFGPDHAALLAAAVPVGHGWPDWRHDADAELSTRLAWPVEGAVFDVLHSHFWPASWGPRPIDDQVAERWARDHLEQWPKLIPLYGHRYTPASPSPSGAPVFSVYQTDVIYYGADLLDYLRRELSLNPAPRAHMPIRQPVPPWSALALGADNTDL